MSKKKSRIGGFKIQPRKSAVEAGLGKGPKGPSPRTSFALSPEVGDRLRDLAYWERRPVVECIEEAILQYVERHEETRGEIYPARPK